MNRTYPIHSTTPTPVSAMPTGASLDSWLPLKPVVFHILLALAERPSHGYGIILAVRERSEGTVQLETGPLYRHLRKLLESGLVVETDERPERDDERRGAYYAITPLGRDVLAAETERLAGLVTYSRKLGTGAGR